GLTMSDFKVFISFVLLLALESIVTSATVLLSIKLSIKLVKFKFSLRKPFIYSNFSPYFSLSLLTDAIKFLLSFSLIFIAISPLPNLLLLNNSLYFHLLQALVQI